VDVPVVLSANRWQVGWLLGGRDLRVVAATFSIEGDLTGQVWWVLRTPDADRVGRRLLARPGVSGLLSTSARAALAEAANIVVSACLSSVGTMVHAKLVPSTPQMEELTVAELVGPPSTTGFRTVLAASFLATNTPAFSGWMVMLFEEGTREEMLRRLGL
jgi:chemotaxis protein CheC